MVKYKEVSEKSEMKELIKNSDRLPYCFTIRSRHRENSLHESFKRKPLMTTLKHSCNSLSGIYKQECIERIIPLKHPLCLKLQKMTFQSPKRYKFFEYSSTFDMNDNNRSIVENGQNVGYDV